MHLQTVSQASVSQSAQHSTALLAESKANKRLKLKSGHSTASGFLERREGRVDTTIEANIDEVNFDPGRVATRPDGVLELWLIGAPFELSCCMS
jgi:hypothetical protein